MAGTNTNSPDPAANAWHTFAPVQTNITQIMKSILSLPLSLLLVFLAVSPILNAQLSLDWALTQGSNQSDFPVNGGIDSDDHIFSMCIFRDTVDLDPGPQEDWLFPIAYEISVLSKFDKDGTYLWGSRLWSPGGGHGFVGEMKNDIILIVADYTDSLIYAREETVVTIANHPGKNICIIQMDTEGKIIAVHPLLNNNNMYFANLFTLNDGSYLISGSFVDTINLATSGGMTSFISKGEYDAYLAHFNSSFKMDWFTTLGGIGDDYIENTFLQNEESIYYTLGHDEPITVVTDDGVKTITPSGEEDGIFGKVSLEDGSIQSAIPFGGSLDDRISSITADEDDNIYICGYFAGDVNFELGGGTPAIFTTVDEGDGFAAKYHQDGSLQWARIITDTDYGGIYTITLERGNELYLAGNYSYHADLDPGPDSLIVDSDHRGDPYVLKLDTDGNMLWAHNFPGTGNEGIRQVLVDDTKVIVNGFYSEVMDADPSSNEQLIVSQGGSDMFTWKFTEEGVISATNQLQPSLEIALYPNPSADEIHITCETDIEYISLHALNGALLTVPTSIQNEKAQINLRGVIPGIYLVKVKSGDQFTVTKVVKE